MRKKLSKNIYKWNDVVKKFTGEKKNILSEIWIMKLIRSHYTMIRRIMYCVVMYHTMIKLICVLCYVVLFFINNYVKSTFRDMKVATRDWFVCCIVVTILHFYIWRLIIYGWCIISVEEEDKNRVQIAYRIQIH